MSLNFKSGSDASRSFNEIESSVNKSNQKAQTSFFEKKDLLKKSLLDSEVRRETIRTF